MINSSSGAQSFNANNQKITIATSGDVTGTDTGIYADQLTGLQIIVNANVGKRYQLSTDNFAIHMLDSVLTDLSLNSGRITSNHDASILLNTGLSGTNNITLGSGTTISNTRGAESHAIFFISDANESANLVVTNNGGTISANDHPSSSAISFNTFLSASVLTVNNAGGIITAGASGNAIKILGANSATITNSSAGAITGAISATTGDMDIANSFGTIAGNISLGSNAGSSLSISGGSVIGNLTFGNAAQILNLSGNGLLAGAVSGAGIINIGDTAF